ncbi:Zinc finger protein 415 [Habropoda laboriosa]|uniref:Zinc finger protein 415 n=1 Tax=Habropoda laboriosa TaxID=597456 RepID=A0A0L7QKS3_9HYME|nr:PREDICTED: zinc finger protein 708-like [Habropoda laboriosa]KOC59170.1 Zinc finger protein 415 [Habropoda laboriosa]
MFIVTKEIDSENISKLCRTCLREDGDKMVCLFVGPAGSSLAAKLRSLSCLEVWQGDGLPEKMCDRCVTRAESALLYREQCRAADRALRQAVLKVSGLTSYTTVAGCKLYQQNQGFVPVQNSHKTLKCIECGAVFANYQELCAHSRLHLPFVQDDIPVQHMHIVESQNPYFNLNFSHLPSNLTNESIQQTQLPPFVRSNVMQTIPTNGENPSRAACALHCSLCNLTFTNRTQLISHSITHSAENVDICEDSNQIPQNFRYERSINSVGNSIRNLSYQRSTTNDNNEMQSLGFPENMDLGEEGSPERVQSTAIHGSETYNLPMEERMENRESIDGYRSCTSNLNYSKDEPIDGEHSEQSRKYKCELCPKFFSQKSKLLTHRLRHSGQQPFKCSSCEKAYSSKSKLNAHMRLHTKTNVHSCKICEKIFAYPSYLREHLKTHKQRTNNESGNEARTEEGKGFECTTCKKRFRLLKNLRAHERLHTGKGLVRCEICDKTFNQTYNLKIHLLTHKATRPHKCEYCNKCFVQKGNLAEHLRIHTKIKPFECKTCGRRFSQSSHLKNHEASHATIRRHQCRLCGKRFKLANHLKRHLILHNGAKSYKCHQCDQLFSQTFSLTRHLKRHESHS